MITRMFHDLTLPLLGFGAMRLPLLADGSGRVDEARTRDMVAYAMQHGLNYFDTAYPYHGGESERIMGRILADYPRESYLLATKFPSHVAAAGRTLIVGADPVNHPLFHTVAVVIKAHKVQRRAVVMAV